MQPEFVRNELEEGKRAVKGIKHRGSTSGSGWRKVNTPIYSRQYIGVLVPICSAVMVFLRHVVPFREKARDLSLLPAWPLFVFTVGKDKEWGHWMRICANPFPQGFPLKIKSINSWRETRDTTTCHRSGNRTLVTLRSDFWSPEFPTDLIFISLYWWSET